MKIQLFYLLAALFTLSGCVSAGREFDFAKASHEIRNGVTTKADLVGWFGKPYRTKKADGGGERIIWQHTKVGFAVGVVEQTELLAVTDAHEVVIEHRIHQKGDPGPNIAAQEFFR